MDASGPALLPPPRLSAPGWPPPRSRPGGDTRPGPRQPPGRAQPLSRPWGRWRALAAKGTGNREASKTETEKDKLNPWGGGGGRTLGRPGRAAGTRSPARGRWGPRSGSAWGGRPRAPPPPALAAGATRLRALLRRGLVLGSPGARLLDAAPGLGRRVAPGRTSKTGARTGPPAGPEGRTGQCQPRGACPRGGTGHRASGCY